MEIFILYDKEFEEVLGAYSSFSGAENEIKRNWMENARESISYKDYFSTFVILKVPFYKN